jgi:putative flippase GtrA
MERPDLSEWPWQTHDVAGRGERYIAAMTRTVAALLSYLTAFGLSFVLNRNLNFRSHAPVGRQLVVYWLAVLINYLAACCEAVYMYSVLRWVVFRKHAADARVMRVQSLRLA